VSKAEIAQSRRAEAIRQVEKMGERLMATVNAQKPTKAQLAELRKTLEDVPEWADVLGDISGQLRYKIIESMAPQPGLHIAVRRQAEKMAKDLGVEQASLLEKLLIDQVVIAWLRWQSVEWYYQRNFEQSITLTKAMYVEKRLTAAHRRYLQAIESLVRVRRLLARAPVQINIAQQQVVQNG
jgi:hypothetical protein